MDYGNNAFPSGYKQYRILCEMDTNEGMTYREIIKFAYELTHGEGSFDPVAHRGYWSGAFVTAGQGFGGHPQHGGWISTLCKKVKSSGAPVYYPNEEGIAAIKKLEKKFKGVSTELAATNAFHDKVQKGRLEHFKDRYASQLENFDNRNKAKAHKRVECSNGMVSESGEELYCDQYDMVPELKNQEILMRGIKLDDEVIYYRKRSGETGDAYIQSIKETSKKIACPRFEISLGLENASIPQISYNEEKDTFFEMGGFEIQIIKKSL